MVVKGYNRAYGNAHMLNWLHRQPETASLVSESTYSIMRQDKRERFEAGNISTSIFSIPVDVAVIYVL